MHDKLKGAPGIYLVGFMGSGKSTAGPLLAARLGWEFVDLDQRIERLAGMPIRQVFELAGEPAFRAVERLALEYERELVLKGRARVIALGGGAFAQERLADRLRDGGMSVWLSCPPEAMWERVKNEGGRPLAKDPDAFQQLYAKREDAYARADARVDSQRPAAEVVEQILALGLI